MRWLMFFVGLMLISCSSGSDDGGTTGGSSAVDSTSLNCSDIAGPYGGSLIFPGIDPVPQTATVNNDCTFVSKSKDGTHSGTLTSSEGNTYYGHGTSPEGCGGPFTVKAVDLGNGNINVFPTCT